MMISEFVPLVAGGWVIQNVANSGVGNYAMQLAKRRHSKCQSGASRNGRCGDKGTGRIVMVDGEGLADLLLRPRPGVPAAIRLPFASPAATGFATFARSGLYAVLIPTYDIYTNLRGEP
jgi:NADPH:quinone reductase-like Zn-dependent oxidoreductase